MKFISNGNLIDLDAGGRLRAWAEERGISTVEMARKTELSQPKISRLMTGTTRMSLEDAAVICRAYRIDYIWLLTGVSM